MKLSLLSSWLADSMRAVTENAVPLQVVGLFLVSLYHLVKASSLFLKTPLYSVLLSFTERRVALRVLRG